MKSVLLTASVCAFMLGALAPVQGATILTFQQANGAPLANDQAVPQAYGDSVAGTVTGDFRYGQAGTGFTPNIETTYTQPVGGDLSTYTGGYGDLETVLYSSFDYSITFTAAEGFMASFESLDVAGFGSNETINVSISNGTDAPFTFSGVLAPGTGHTTLSFAGIQAAVGQAVTLSFDIPNFNVGISNLQFSQVPEPTSALLLAGGAALVGMVRRRRA